VVRRVEPWSVAKISFLLCIVVSAVLLVAGVLLWRLAVSTDTIDNLESFIQELFALETFTLDGQQIFRAAAVSSVLVVLAGTATAVVGAVLFNLLSDLVGGVRFVVIEEEELAPAPSQAARTSPVAAAASAPPQVSEPDQGPDQHEEGDDEESADRSFEAPHRGDDAGGEHHDEHPRRPGADADGTGGDGSDEGVEGTAEPLPVRRAAGGSG
jgi:hypothetical protein